MPKINWKYYLALAGLFLSVFGLARIGSQGFTFGLSKTLPLLGNLELFVFLPLAFVLAFSVQHLFVEGQGNASNDNL